MTQRSYKPAALERAVVQLWDEEDTFRQSLERRVGARRFSFYDGPPYATGAPHYGHILQSTIKDTVTRYWTMRGYLVDRRVGWDCHGLPVENMVEKELEVKTKREIEERGIDAFNAACREAVLRHVGEFTALLQRLGRWADYDHAYLTMDANFVESAWWVFKVARERGLVYRGLRSSPYCPRCETPLSHHEAVQGYREVTDPSLILKVPLLDEPTTFLLVWTTTPWTLPGNAAIAVHPDVRYARIRVGDERWILAKDRLPGVVREDHTLEDEFAGRVLAGKSYEPLYTFVETEKPAYRVVAAPFVSALEGTGIVHIAPAFGADDFQLAETEDLPILCTVDERGCFLPAVTPWAGKPVKEADAEIVRDLESRGQVLEASTIRHEYPHCWRCETPLLSLATESWFIAVTKIKEQLLKNAEAIRWVPAHLKEGRFGQGLRDAPDWAVSRTRFWGIPLPAWRCSGCEGETVIGSLEELRAAGGDLGLLKSPYADPDLHRPYVDRVVLKCQHCGGEAKRVPEVLDVWFDAGSMPYGQWHYPFENNERVEESFPADFIAEALEQTRGWFYTLHVLAGVLTVKDLGLGVAKPAYRNVVASGLILAEDGKKLSKRLGNYPDPGELIEKYGADTLRLFLLQTRLGEDLRFSERLVGDLYRRFTLLLWNIWTYYHTYASVRHSGAKPKNLEAQGDEIRYSAQDDRSLPLLDRWVLSRTWQLAADVQAAMDGYRIDEAARALLPYVDDLSTWYVRRSRGREAALPVLRNILRNFSVIAAPFIPFLAEHIHRELVGTSPHLADYPSLDSRLLTPDSRLLAHMRAIRGLAAAGHRARAERKVKVRQPLSEVALVGKFPALAAAGEEGLALLRDELNVKNIVVRSEAKDLARDSSSLAQNDQRLLWVEVPGGRLGLNTTLTSDLKTEGLVRDLIRAVQDLRKKAGYRFDDVIRVRVVTDSTEVRAALEQFRDLFLAETKSREILPEKGEADASGEVTIAGATVSLGVLRE